MQITDVLAQMGGLRSMARELGVSETQVATGAEALVPAILGGFKKQAQSQPSGLEGLGGLLGQLGGGGLLEDVLSPQPTNVSRGNDVLGQIFGSKDVSRAVAQNAATRSGLDSTLLKKMLPMLAMLVAGYLAKRGQGQGAQPSTGGGLGGLLGGLLGGQADDAGIEPRENRDAGVGGLLGGLLGGQRDDTGAEPRENRGSGLGSLLDMNGDGNALDDILRMTGKVLR